MEGTKRSEEITVVQIPNDLHEKLKMQGLILKKTLKELVREIVAEWLGRMA